MKYLNIFLASFILLLLVFWGKDLFFFGLSYFGLAKQGTASIESISLSGDMRIYLDNVDIGVVRGSQSKFDLEGISSGVHKVTLKKISELEYPEFSTTLNFLEGFATTLVYEIGPSESVSQGWTIEPMEKDSNGNSILEISPNIDATSIRLYDENTGKEINPIDDAKPLKFELSFDSGYKVSIQKDGYMPINFNIFGFNDGSPEIKKAKGFNYRIKVYLFELPLILNYI